ncbi:hypothetical protein FLK61_33705 [Paenalkalicoccus suaedae]|uniref:Uncharacterized protein n=1 Tax=Paenalkalicoccus suaedae TaxID=2592382 RepID=A0A859FE61_9BACI|nr:hypothetical protein [Paenalkalicoccus suaedae]QKS71643.1 hypothetical protein FLK61_33705 [Paenalkalicoccus suaedae]
MQLVDWEYRRRYSIAAVFSKFPNSTVIFRSFPNYYFIYTVKWSQNDPVVTREDLCEMETIINDNMGLLEQYNNRRAAKRESIL